MSTIGLDRIRNFSIIAHIDHGKSTLADRILELVGAISPYVDGQEGGEERVLDKLRVEKERGITVKAQTASVIFESCDGQEYLLNLIDTPGHVDFSSEVSRSLSTCQGVILLVDANQGVQAQTVANFFMAFANDLAVVPVLNKVDLPNAQPDVVKSQLQNLFEIDPDSVLLASAKTGTGIREILEAVVTRIPPPLEHGKGKTLRMILQDSWYDKYRGTVNLVQVVDGILEKNHVVTSHKTGLSYPVKTLGLLTPNEMDVAALYPGQIGVLTCSMRSPSEALVGDTFHLKDKPVEPFMDVSRPKPMVFAGLYPYDQSELAKMKSAIEKVSLNDYSVTVVNESSPALGSGFRLGFLGILHMEVFTQRLEDEYDAQVVVTSPTVPYRIKIKPQLVKKYDCETFMVNNPANLPPNTDIDTYYEPMVKGTVICPHEYLSSVYSLATEARGIQTAMDYIDQHRVKLEFRLPLSEIVTTFFDRLKSVTSGYGSFDYEEAGYEESHLAKLEILLNEVAVPEMASIVHASRARERGKETVAKLKEHLTRQQFSVKIQATVGSKVMARDDLKALRKDVTAKCYGGDLRRKMKLLKYQAEGKKKMKNIGRLQISQDVFRKILT